MNRITQLDPTIATGKTKLSEAEFSAARAAKLTDAEIIETTANVALNILTNCVNHVARSARGRCVMANSISI